MSKVAGEGVGQLGGSVSAESRRVTNSSWNSSLPFIHDAKSRLTVSLSQDEQASLTLRPSSTSPPIPSARERDYTSISRSYVSYFVCGIPIEGLLIRWLVFRDWPGFKLDTLLRRRSQIRLPSIDGTYFTFERIFSSTEGIESN